MRRVITEQAGVLFYRLGTKQPWYTLNTVYYKNEKMVYNCNRLCKRSCYLAVLFKTEQGIEIKI